MTSNQAEHDDLHQRLSYHPVTDQTRHLFEQNRRMALTVGHRWIDTLPAGRHKALALTALQEALMWANAAVACDTPAEP